MVVSYVKMSACVLTVSPCACTLLTGALDYLVCEAEFRPIDRDCDGKGNGGDSKVSVVGAKENRRSGGAMSQALR